MKAQVHQAAKPPCVFAPELVLKNDNTKSITRADCDNDNLKCTLTRRVSSHRNSLTSRISEEGLVGLITVIRRVPTLVFLYLEITAGGDSLRKAKCNDNLNQFMLT